MAAGCARAAHLRHLPGVREIDERAVGREGALQVQYGQGGAVLQRVHCTQRCQVPGGVGVTARAGSGALHRGSLGRSLPGSAEQAEHTSTAGEKKKRDGNKAGAPGEG